MSGTNSFPKSDFQVTFLTDNLTFMPTSWNDWPGVRKLEKQAGLNFSQVLCLNLFTIISGTFYFYNCVQHNDCLTGETFFTLHIFKYLSNHSI